MDSLVYILSYRHDSYDEGEQFFGVFSTFDNAMQAAKENLHMCFHVIITESKLDCTEFKGCSWDLSYEDFE